MTKTYLIAFVAIFSALNFAVAALNRYFPLASIPSGISPGHMVIDAILCTAIMLTAAYAIGQFGGGTLIGIITGLIMVITGGKPPALVSWAIRGLVIDAIIFKVFKGNLSLKACATAAFFAFLLQTIIGKTLFLLLFMPLKTWKILLGTLFLPLTIVGSIISVVGAYIAYNKFIPTIRRVIRTGV